MGGRGGSSHGGGGGGGGSSAETEKRVGVQIGDKFYEAGEDIGKWEFVDENGERVNYRDFLDAVDHRAAHRKAALDEISTDAAARKIAFREFSEARDDAREATGREVSAWRKKRNEENAAMDRKLARERAANEAHRAEIAAQNARAAANYDRKQAARAALGDTPISSQSRDFMVAQYEKKRTKYAMRLARAGVITSHQEWEIRSMSRADYARFVSELTEAQYRIARNK
jgi:hypothetical protein